MGNVLRVIARDLKRLITTPAAWAVVLFLMILPSLYTWFNVAGFWNPYDNTGNLRVCVVNEDAGAYTQETGQLEVGERIVAQLEGNDQLGWAFVDRAQAEEEVRSGTAYAAFILPDDFSANIASILTGDFEQPHIEYYVNEKVGPVAPKITDTGASTLDSTVNEAFVSTASEAVALVIDEKLDEMEQAGNEAKDTAEHKIAEARKNLHDTREELDGFAEKVAGITSQATDVHGSLSDAKSQLDGLSGTLANVSKLAASADASLLKFSSAAGTTLDATSSQISQTAARVDATVAKDANVILKAKGSVDGALSRAQALTQETDLLIAELTRIQKALHVKEVSDRLGELISQLSEVNTRTKRNVEGLQKVSQDSADAATSTRDATSAVDTATQQTLSSADAFRSTMSSSVIPSISNALASVTGVAADLSAQASGQKAVVNEAVLALEELRTTLDTAAKALSETSKKLAAFEDELGSLASDISALGTSSAMAQLIGSERINPETIADFMMSPTKLQTEELYPLNAYGSAMAPLFINLTLWIGVFMLMVIFRLEVDDEGIKRLTIAQRFFARFILLAPIACMQAAICCTGCMVLGVQSVNTGAFYLTAIIASLSYLAIQYTLSTTLQHVGKALCIILVFVQIPGASGIYPIEMTPDFFRTVYPLFPFTYGINAMRETISGFYGSQWLAYVGVLAAYLVAMLAIGALVRPYLANLNRMFAREIAESDLIIGESIELPARRWRMSQLLSLIADREEYRAALEQRVQRFMRLYPQLLKAALVAGLLVPALVAAILMPLRIDKVVILTTWLIWLVLVVAFLLVVEFFRDSLSHQLSLEAMDYDEMRTLYEARNDLTSVKPLEQDAAADSRGGETTGEAEADESGQDDDVEDDCARDEGDACDDDEEGAR